MIYAETERLILRSLEHSDLPRIVELIGDWDVARWLVNVPHPYSLKNAEGFYERMSLAMQNGAAEYFLLQQKKDGQQIGAIGLHPPREPSPQPGELVIGYWLGKDYWRQGLMTEALPSVYALAFQREDVTVLTATTDPTNEASQKVLRKTKFSYIGLSPHRDATRLRGDQTVTRWQLKREDYEQQVANA